jgi:hypothetical protein
MNQFDNWLHSLNGGSERRKASTSTWHRKTGTSIHALSGTRTMLKWQRFFRKATEDGDKRFPRKEGNYK